MRRRLSGHLALLLIAGSSLAGCVQATRHSNTMVFGTNTTFGLSAGQDVGGIPSVTVGYRRQEAVIMPLVANTSDNGTYQTPCNIEGMPPLLPGQMNPCLLIGLSGRGSIDTYSVLASFGAEFGGSGTQANASGNLAQFFSTGIAAQNLAIRGGAALVAASDSATAQATSTLDPGVAAALASGDVRAAIGGGITTLNTTLDQVVARYQQTADAAALAAEIDAFESAAGINPAVGVYAEAGCSRPELVGADAAKAAAARTACLAKARAAYATVPTERLQAALQQRQNGGAR